MTFLEADDLADDLAALHGLERIVDLVELDAPGDHRVEVAQKGTLTSFCIVNVQFYGQAMEVPYTSGLILLDGADLPIMHLLQEVDVKDVRIGMRVEAVWVPDDEITANLESIRYFRPIDEPDVEVHQPGEHGWEDQ
jgi:hypothetical protein